MTTLEKLSQRGNAIAARVLDAFNPDQPRDDHGRFDTGTGVGTPRGAGGEHYHAGMVDAHMQAAKRAEGHGMTGLAKKEREAAQAHQKALSTAVSAYHTHEHTYNVKTALRKTDAANAAESKLSHASITKLYGRASAPRGPFGRGKF